jgi:hypothetical protein
MCFNNHKREKPRIAETDIVCYKFIYKNNTNPYASCGRVTYIRNKKAPKVKMDISGELEIHVGYHSYITKSGASRAKYSVFFAYNGNMVVKKFIIPAGSYYYKNRTQYVSNQIMMIE